MQIDKKVCAELPTGQNKLKRKKKEMIKWN